MLHELSWHQVLLFHEEGIQYDFARRGIPLKKGATGDGPDVDRIENELGFMIRR